MGGSASISIVIPTLNAGRAFGTSLHRIMGQGQVPREILVVDSGSKDATHHIVDQFPDARWVEAGTPSGPRAWNTACQQARGDVVVFLSQDALPADGDWLQHLVEPFDDPSVGASCGRQRGAASAEPLLSYRLSKRFGDEPESRRGRFGDPLAFPTIIFSIENAAIRRSVWQGIHFNEHLPVGADRAWARQALMASYTVVYVPPAGVNRTEHQSLPAVLHDAVLTGWTDEYLADEGDTVRLDGQDSGWAAAWYLLKRWRWDRLPTLMLEDAAIRYGYKLGRRLHRLAPSIRGRIAPEIAAEEPHRPLTEREKAA